MSESYQEYVSHFQLRQEQLAARVSDQHILELADKIIRWDEDLVGPLELTREEINDIHEETNKPKLKRRKVLQIWQDKKRPHDTYGLLLQKLLEGKHAGAAETLCTLLQKSRGPAPGQATAFGRQAAAIPSQGAGQGQGGVPQGAGPFFGQYGSGPGQLPQQHHGSPYYHPPHPQEPGGSHYHYQGPAGGGFNQQVGYQQQQQQQQQQQEYYQQVQRQQQLRAAGVGFYQQRPNLQQLVAPAPSPNSQQPSSSVSTLQSSHQEAASVETRTLEQSTSSLELALSGLESSFVHFLNSEGFITDGVHDEVLKPTSMLRDDQKAGELVMGIKKRVRQDKGSYAVLLRRLKDGGKYYEPIVKKLEAEYTRQLQLGGTQSPAKFNTPIPIEGTV